MYKCKHFAIKELVHPALLKQAGEDKCWLLLDSRILKCADLIRERYGKTTVNANGLTDCGLRQMDAGTGAMYSAHKYGRALDLHISTIEVAASKIKNATERKKYKIGEYNKVRKALIEDDAFGDLCFENNISWLHCDVANRPNRLFNP